MERAKKEVGRGNKTDNGRDFSPPLFQDRSNAPGRIPPEIGEKRGS